MNEIRREKISGKIRKGEASPLRFNRISGKVRKDEANPLSFKLLIELEDCGTKNRSEKHHCSPSPLNFNIYV